MRGLVMIAEVAMLAAGLGLIWFGSQSLRHPRSPEAGRMLDDAIVLADQAQRAIADEPRDRRKNAGQDWNDLRGRLAKYTTPDEQATLEAIDVAADPASARVAFAKMKSRISGRTLPIAALVVAGMLIVGVVILERRRKQSDGDSPVAIPAT